MLLRGTSIRWRSARADDGAGQQVVLEPAAGEAVVEHRRPAVARQGVVEGHRAGDVLVVQSRTLGAADRHGLVQEVER